MSFLVLMAKAPRPGLSKTRLAGPDGAGAQHAARLADAFLRDTLATMRALVDVERLLWFAPADAEPYFKALDPDAHLLAQPDTDFGARVAAAFDAAFTVGAERVVVLGSDTPHLEPARIEQAFAALDTKDLVLGPCPDGGYYLLGLRHPCAALFERIDWSTARVREQTLERARAAGLHVEELEELFDVDTPLDLELLRRWIALHGPARCPHTARALAPDRGTGRGGATAPARSSR